MDKLKALQAFVLIVERGSLTEAAEALDSSLSAMVRTLGALESQLGVRLLNRTTRRLSLTEDGRQYLERARHILAALDDADRSLGAQQAEPSGTLSVTAPVLFGQYHVAPSVTSFLQRYPRMRINLVLLDRVVNLVEEGLDVGVRIGPLEDSTVVARGVGRIRRVVVASPALLRRLGTPKHPRDLAKLPCLRFSATDGVHWVFREAGHAFTVGVQGQLECNLSAPMLEACAAGLGFGRFLSYQAAPWVAAKRLRIVLGDYEVEPWPVSLTYPSARLLPSRTKVFIEWMVGELKSSV
ncbi:MAG: LysR family transcriptional regulator [Variovorax sp.]|nr:MAG: LysR family transcriptional regulator [Variovorax sp.]